MLENYLPILVFLLLGLLFGVVPIMAAKILGPDRPDSAKGASVTVVLGDLSAPPKVIEGETVEPKRLSKKVND